MNIQPIGTYPASLNYIGPTKRTHKKTRSKTISSNSKLTEKEDLKDGVITLPDITKELFIDDPNTAIALWAKDPIEAFENPDIHAQEMNLLAHAKQVHKLYRRHIQRLHRSSHTPTRSLQHLTLPEAILFMDILSGQFPQGHTRSLIQFSPLSSSHQDVAIQLTTLNKAREQRLVELHYKLQDHHVTMTEKKQVLGQCRYVLRNKKLEEIEGTYKGLRLTLDPIWSRQDNITSESIKIGYYNTDLIHDKQYKRGRWRSDSNGKVLPMSVSDLKSERLAPGLFQTKKKSIIGDTELHITLLFSAFFFMPIGGIMTTQSQIKPGPNKNYLPQFLHNR